ncbi:AEC family transporter [Roseomonas marmotae]|uniref:AEC family transporter n=1 Tax=Roseomonas marmotae TaxID=2768161 RepID=A0ABS3KE28_9PROT|nr:AEC family transporter [Roseomonas marmotae]MBO1075733.1 AEC family transporter [Roseomonas marmotae]QTI80463.1 AEC family transporter [Roseomonas marmotae]
MSVLLQIVVPIFALIGIGYLSARRRWISEEGLRGMSGFVFTLALPCLLFNGATTPHAGGGGTALAFFAGCLATYALAMLLARGVLGMKLGEAGTFGLNASFGNTGMIGVPLVLVAFGHAGLAQLLAIIGLHSLILLPIGTVIGEVAHGGRAPVLKILRATIVSVLRNPIVISVLAGFIVYQGGIPVPEMLRYFLKMVGDAAVPAALFCLGATLVAFDARRDWPSALLCSGLKLLLMPLLVWLAGLAIGLPPLQMAVALIAAAMPTGANAFFLSRRYAAGAERSGATVLLSTLLSMATVTALLVLLEAG